MKIQKAIITVAGTGTRFLPITKSIPKEMLPIIDKPIVQYLVEELAASGTEDIVLVIRSYHKAVEDHFDSNFELEFELSNSGKTDHIKAVQSIAKLANFMYIRQEKSMPYGNGTPLLASARLVSDGPFFYLFGDDVTKSKVPVCKQLADVYEKNPDVDAVIATQKMPRNVLYRYGVVKLKKGSSNEVESIVEKPAPGTKVSNLVSFGRYLFTPKILPIIKKLKLGKDNELWTVDAINELAKNGKVLAHEIEGRWMTTGDPWNFLHTTLEFAKDRPELKKELKKYFKSF